MEEERQRPDFSWRNWGPGMRLWLVFTMYVLLMLLFFSLVQVPSLSWLSGDGSQGWPLWLLRLSHAWVLALIFGLPVLILGHLYPAEGKEFRKLAVIPHWKLAALAVLAIVLIEPGSDWLYGMNVSMSPAYTAEETKELSKYVTVWEMPGIGDLLINTLVLALVPAICEELFFRGTIQRLVFSWSKNVHTAVFVSAFLFALLHHNPRIMLPVGLLGVLLGYMLAWSGSIWLSILVHFINNMLFLLNQFFNERSTAYAQFAFPDWAGPVSLAATAGVMFLMWRVARKQKQPEQLG